MMEPVRFTYDAGRSGGSLGSLLAYLPIRLSHGEKTIARARLLDTGSTVNVLPYSTGLELGLVWEKQTTPVVLTGTLGRVAAFGVILLGQVDPFPPIELAFARPPLHHPVCASGQRPAQAGRSDSHLAQILASRGGAAADPKVGGPARRSGGGVFSAADENPMGQLQPSGRAYPAEYGTGEEAKGSA